MTQNRAFLQAACRVKGACLQTGSHRENTPKRAALQLCRQGCPFFLEKSKRERGGERREKKKEGGLCLQSCNPAKRARGR